MTVPSHGLLRRYFSGLAEHTFLTRLGVADPPLIDYVSDLLVRFVRAEAVFRVRNLAGRRLYEMADMLAEGQERIGDARREVHRHIGDFALFWTGVYPEALKKLRDSSRKDRLLDYQAEGKRAYWIASTIEASDDETASGEVLNRLSRQFELCAYGLSEVRRQWESGDSDDVPRTFLIN
jgi:hypothetical protein